MAIMAKAGSNGNFKPCPAGLHQAVCVDVIDRGVLPGQFGEKHKVDVRWQVEQGMEDGKPYMIQQRYTLSLNEKATLRHHLESWRGKPLSDQELAGFDLEKLIGANCQIVVIHRPGDQGKVWANVQTITPLGKGMKKLTVRDYTREPVKAAEPEPEDYSDQGDEEPDDSPVPF